MKCSESNRREQRDRKGDQNPEEKAIERGPAQGNQAKKFLREAFDQEETEEEGSHQGPEQTDEETGILLIRTIRSEPDGLLKKCDNRFSLIYSSKSGYPAAH